MKNTFLEIFKYSFKLFSCIVTFLLIPLSFIYNSNALLAMSYPFDIACDLSIAQLSLILLSIVGSILVGLSSMPIYRLLKDKAAAILHISINAVLILIIVGWTIRYLRFWLLHTFNVQPFAISKGIPLLIIFSISFILIVLFNKYVTSAVTRKIIDKLFKGVIVTMFIGLILLSFKAVNYMISDSSHSNSANRNLSDKFQTANQATNPDVNGISKTLPNIILVTFDALSAEDMSLYGYHINTTPNIDALAKESYVFDTMIANSNWTRPSSASIIIGKYPNTHKIFGVYHSTKKMSYNRENLARVLRERGYKTAAVTSNYYTHPLENMTYRDFDYLPDLIIKRGPLPPVQKILSFVPFKVRTFSNTLVLLGDILAPLDTFFIRYMPDYFTETPYPPDLTFAKSLDFILNTKSLFFIWIHILPPHNPYSPSKKFRYKLLDKRIFNNFRDFANIFLDTQYPPEKQQIIDKLRLRYDETIMYADDEFGKFINLLSSKGIYDTSILIVSSDHGESFRKGYLQHGGVRLANLYQQFIRIPLVIHTPKQKIGQKIKSNAEHVDIAPTVLDLLNMKVPEWMEGESLKGAMYYNQPIKRPKYSMNLSPNTVNQPIPKGAIAVIKEDYKYIFQIEENRGELYDIKNDPYEENNLVNTQGHLAEELKQLVIKKIYQDGKKGH